MRLTVHLEKTMGDGVVKLRLPTATEFIALRRAAGWDVPSPEDVAEALANTLFAACAEKDSQLIGSGRVVGDGALCFFVQDLIVLPAHQKQGWGTRIMDALMGYVNATAKPTAFIGLFSARGMESFYSRYGFIERPHKHLGPGMVFFKK